MEHPAIQPILITLEYPPQVGGVAQYYYSIVRAAPQPIMVITGKDLPPRWWQMIPALARRCRKFPRTHLLVGQLLPLGTVAWLVHRLTGVQYTVFVHGMDVLVPQRFWRKRWLLRRIFRQAHAIIAVSEFTKKLVLQFDPTLKQLQVVHPAAGITPQVTAKSVADLPAEFILSVGRLVERKGFDMVMRSLVDHPQLHYVIAGSGGDRGRLEALAQSLSVQERVHWYEQLSNQEIAYLYQQCLFLAMPSRVVNQTDVEGFGIVVLEANSFGKPAIGGANSGMSDAIVDQQTGLLVDGADPAAVSQAVAQLLNPTVRQTLAKAAQQHASQSSWEYAAKRIIAIVQGND